MCMNSQRDIVIDLYTYLIYVSKKQKLLSNLVWINQKEWGIRVFSISKDHIILSTQVIITVNVQIQKLKYTSILNQQVKSDLQSIKMLNNILNIKLCFKFLLWKNINTFLTCFVIYNLFTMKSIHFQILYNVI